MTDPNLAIGRERLAALLAEKLNGGMWSSPEHYNGDQKEVWLDRADAIIDVLAPVTPAQAAEVLSGDDVFIARMAKAMHDGPLMADEYEYRVDTPAGKFCVELVRAALKAISEVSE